MLLCFISVMLFLFMDRQGQACHPTIEKECLKERGQKTQTLSRKEINAIEEEASKLYRQFIRPSFEVSIPALEKDRLELRGMYEIDQLVRKKIVSVIQERTEDKTNQYDYFKAQLFQEMNFIDQKNQQALSRLLEEYDIFDKEELGKEAVHYAWVLLQHADNNLSLQEKGLKIITPLIKKKEGLNRMYAMLYDRVALNNNRPQRYGTQFILNSDKEFVLRPLENKEQVHHYRKELNLESLEEEIAKMKQAYSFKPLAEN